MRRALKKWRLWIIIFICASILIFLWPVRDGFQNNTISAAQINPAIVDPSIKDVQMQQNIMTNYQANCQMLAKRVGEIQNVKTALDNIKSQINQGAIDTQMALLKLQTIQNNYLKCGGDAPPAMSKTMQTSYCNAISDAVASFTEQMNPGSASLPDTSQTNIAGINALINQEYENVMAYSILINKMNMSLRCDV